MASYEYYPPPSSAHAPPPPSGIPPAGQMRSGSRRSSRNGSYTDQSAGMMGGGYYMSPGTQTMTPPSGWGQAGSRPGSAVRPPSASRMGGNGGTNWPGSRPGSAVRGAPPPHPNSQYGSRSNSAVRGGGGGGGAPPPPSHDANSQYGRRSDSAVRRSRPSSRERGGMPSPVAAVRAVQDSRLENSDEFSDDDEEEPATEEEIHSMAAHLGMDPNKDSQLLWIAAEAFDVPLPEGWSEHFDWDGKVYFYNRMQDMVVRDHPLDDFYRELYKIVKEKGSSVSDGEARAYAAAQAAALAQAAAYGQKATRRKGQEVMGSSSNKALRNGGSSRPSSSSGRSNHYPPGGAAPHQGNGQDNMGNGASPVAERQFVENTMNFMQSIVETMTKTQVENTAMQAQMQAELLKQLQSSQTGQSAGALVQRDVLMKLETKMSSLQELQHKELAQIKSLEETHRGQMDSLKTQSARAANEAARVAAEANMATQGMAQKLQQQQASLEEQRSQLEERIEALQTKQEAEVEAVRAKAHEEISSAQTDLEETITVLQSAGDVVDPDVLEVMAMAAEELKHGPEAPTTPEADDNAALDSTTADGTHSEGDEAEEHGLLPMHDPADDGAEDKGPVAENSSGDYGFGKAAASSGDVKGVANNMATAITLLREKLTHTERVAADAQDSSMQEKLARMNHEMEESLRERIRELEAEHEATVQRLQKKVERAEQEAESAREDVERERGNSERMMQTAMQMAAEAGSKAIKENSSKLPELQSKLEVKERELAHANAALQGERKKLSDQEAANKRIEAMLHDMRSGASSLDARLKQFDQLLKTKEEEKSSLMAEVATLKAQAETAQSSANQSALAAQQTAMNQVVQLNATLEAERMRAKMDLQKAEQDHQRALQEERSNGRISKAARKTMDRMQDEAASLKKAYKAVKDEQKSFMLYSFNKMAEASTALEQMAALVNREQTIRERLDVAVRDCDSRMEPLVAEKRRLFNELLTAKGNIRVFCRVRPFSQKEMAEGTAEAFTFPDSGSDMDGHSGRFIATVGDGRAVQNKQYEFDKVFGTSTTQEEAYDAVQPLIQSTMDGYNVCVFAYGQTGSGKTFTMEGPPDNRGITYRAFDELFRMAKAVWGAYEYTFHVNLMEVYNEVIRDLLVSKKTFQERHDVKTEDDGRVVVTGISAEAVTTPEEFIALMRRGSANRSTGSTNMNERSSRSHLIMAINVTCRNLVTGRVKKSKLSLVDLAGSERVGKSGAEGERLKEAMHINKSLSALGDVISSLTAKRGHIPFRNSKLTHILSDSLGNDSKTLLFVACSPAQWNAHESSCSLNFAQRARNVDLGQGAGGSAVRRLKESASISNKEQTREIRRLEEELVRVKEAASRAEDESSKKKTKGSDESKELRAEIKELKKQLAGAQGAGDRLKNEAERKESLMKSLEVSNSGLAAQLDEVKLELQRAQRQRTSPPQSSSNNGSRPSPEQSSRIQYLEERLSKREAELADLRSHQHPGGGTIASGMQGGSRPGSALRPTGSRPGSALHRPSASSTQRGALESGDNSSAELTQLRTQLAGLSDINKTLLEKCKASKADKALLQKQVDEKDSALKMLDAKYKLLVKKFSEGSGA